MSRYYNEHYSYDDISMWQDDTWMSRAAPIVPMLDALSDCLTAMRKDQPLPEYYPDRHDEVRDKSNRCAYFPEVLDEWKQKGLVFAASGMMGVTLAPVSVVEHRKRDPRVLYIPEHFDDQNPHYAMNLIKEYEEVLETAAKEEILIQFLPLPTTLFVPLVEKAQETQGTYRIEFHEVYLDLTRARQAGFRLNNVANFGDYKPTKQVAGCEAVDITDKWQYRLSHQYIISRLYWGTVPEWEYDRHVRSAVGRIQAESMRLEHDYDCPDDPALLEKWRKMGLRYENHNTQKEWWVTLTPESAFTKPDHKLPVLCVFKEPRTSVPFLMQTALQFYYNFIDIAAHGEFIMLFFAMEQADDNDLLVDILEEAQQIYPIDPGRVYLTGQSHNGYYVLEFYRRHPDIVAAAATLADPIGLQTGATVKYYDRPDIIESFSKHDMPLININGQLENKFSTAEPGSALEMENAIYFQRRLQAFRCPQLSIEEIIAARTSDDYATRINGVPSNHTEVRYIMGNECYVSDFRNVDGKCHFRCATLENMPHMIAPQMAELAWEFIRRFARDRDTGETIELY